ncbi:protein of unknown function [Methylocella tundrae]|uniref:Uncharacterized protein n=1 Tax=Methylocella tundrae TaxID=227605 RepID=A0A4U8YW70_METTU|nr:protein of unknown function [Methylocella tundrae]
MSPPNAPMEKAAQRRPRKEEKCDLELILHKIKRLVADPLCLQRVDFCLSAPGPAIW